MSKKNDDINNLFNKAKNKITPPPTQRKTKSDTIAPLKKIGRPSKRKEGIEYSKLTVHIPTDLRHKIKLALLTTHKHLDHTQDSLVEAALKEYLEG